MSAMSKFWATTLGGVRMFGGIAFSAALLSGNDDLQEELSKNVDYINNELGKLAEDQE